MKWKIYHNFDTPKIVGTKNNGQSLTVPDQTLSIRQLVSRHTRGQSVEMLPMTYNDTLEEIEKMDKVDKAQLLKDNAKKMRDLERKFEQSQKQKAQKNLSDLEKAAVLQQGNTAPQA